MIFFRADGNSQIGLGHVMRCLSIAEAARNLGEKCTFITASDDATSVIKGRSFDCIVLGSDYRDMESEGIIQVLKEYSEPIVIVDSYYVTEGYLSSLKDFCGQKGGKLIYIDDLLAFAYPCHMLINYEIYGLADDYNVLYGDKSKPEYLMGTAYAPLRGEFLGLSDRKVKEKAENILVTTGGSDPEHLAIELVRIAKKSDRTFHFVVGAANADRTLIEQEAKDSDNILIYVNVTNMSELMQKCDVAISASGSTIYELCATQTPAISFVVADNQIHLADGFSSKGIIHKCGDSRLLGTQKLAEELVREAVSLCDDFERRCLLAREMKTVVDGHGPERIMKAVLGK